MLTASTNSMQEEQDWETEAKTGSSLANTSDLGDPSMQERMPGLASILVPRIIQYGGTTRYNEAYMVCITLSQVTARELRRIMSLSKPCPGCY